MLNSIGSKLDAHKQEIPLSQRVSYSFLDCLLAPFQALSSFFYRLSLKFCSFSFSSSALAPSLKKLNSLFDSKEALASLNRRVSQVKELDLQYIGYDMNRQIYSIEIGQDWSLEIDLVGKLETGREIQEARDLLWKKVSSFALEKVSPSLLEKSFSLCNQCFILDLNRSFFEKLKTFSICLDDNVREDAPIFPMALKIDPIAKKSFFSHTRIMNLLGDEVAVSFEATLSLDENEEAVFAEADVQIKDFRTIPLYERPACQIKAKEGEVISRETWFSEETSSE